MYKCTTLSLYKIIDTGKTIIFQYVFFGNLPSFGIEKPK